VLVSGYIRWLDAIVMRLMEGLMAIPAILLAIALVSLFRAGLLSVIVAIVVPEIPAWCASCARSCFGAREPYVKPRSAPVRPRTCARSPICRTRFPALIVQGTFHLRQPILIEAILSFLGIGIRRKPPTWGTSWRKPRLFRMLRTTSSFRASASPSRARRQCAGDGLRDRLDPKRRGGCRMRRSRSPRVSPFACRQEPIA